MSIRERIPSALLGMAIVAVVIAPALWNGYPIIFPDTGGYLQRPAEATLELGRSALYGTFLAGGVPFDFWPNIIAQAALALWLIELLLRAHRLPGGRSLLLAVALGLSVASSLPWIASTLMPDILLPSAVLALYLIAFRRAELKAAEAVALAVAVAFAIASHSATLALCIGLLIGLALMPLLALPRAQLKLPALAVAAGVLLAPVSNLVVAGKFTFTPGGEIFLFGRLVQDGIVQRYLDDRCPDETIKLCAFKDTMPKSADDWLWAPGNPMGELGGWRAYEPEARRIIFDTLRMYPGLHIASAARTTFDQLLLMKTEVSTPHDWLAPAIALLGELVPQIMPRLSASKQLSAPATVDAVLAAFNVVHVAAAALSLIALLAVVIFARRLKIGPPSVALASVVLLAVLGNAAICGIFSNPVDRYQSRLVWIAPLAVAVIVLARRRASR